MAGLLNRDMGDFLRGLSASNSIVTTWQITFESIRQERPSSTDLLAFLSLFQPPGNPGMDAPGLQAPQVGQKWDQRQ